MENMCLEKPITVEEYNNEPVFYCTKCLSLRVKSINDDIDYFVDYCDDCGSTEIDTTDIDTWMKMYRERYGKDFLN